MTNKQGHDDGEKAIADERLVLPVEDGTKNGVHAEGTREQIPANEGGEA